MTANDGGRLGRIADRCRDVGGCLFGRKIGGWEHAIRRDNTLTKQPWRAAEAIITGARLVLTPTGAASCSGLLIEMLLWDEREGDHGRGN